MSMNLRSVQNVMNARGTQEWFAIFCSGIPKTYVAVTKEADEVNSRCSKRQPHASLESFEKKRQQKEALPYCFIAPVT